MISKNLLPISFTIFFSHFLITILAVCGFGVSLYIYSKKRKSRFSCFLHLKCDLVLNSKYSKLFGIPLEWLGMAYFSFVVLLHVYFLIPQFPIPDFLIFISMLASGFAILFSLYLIFVQSYVLKQFCSYCLVSAFISICIFVLILLNLPHQLIPVLAHLKPVIVILHLFAMILGLGGATYSDIFFMKFLKNFRFDKSETKILTVISQVIWVGIAISILSGIALFLPESERLLESSKFLAKNVIFLILILNGIAMHAFIIPKLIQISFIDKLRHKIPSHPLRKAAFIMGAISLTSWYSVFILGSLSSVALTLGQILGIYGSLLIIAIIGSMIFEHFMLASVKSKD